MINPIEYIIVIPSYKRSESIGLNTLKVLNEKKVPASKIFIFVANENEEMDYLDNVDKNLYNKIIIGKLGLKNQRNFITKYYPENTYIVECDDDLKEISYLQNGIGETRVDIQKTNKLYPMEDMDKFFKEAYTRLIDNKSYIWGIYPVHNAFFLSDKITTDLRFLVGPMFGKINRHNPDLLLELDEKEDVERTLRHYKLDGSVIRYWNVTIKTNYYKNKGGMQSENKDRYLEAEKSANYLISIFPEYTKKWYKGVKQRPEIKLIAKKKSKYIV
tara:strand:+ start:97 stop:915 length:819 start_codon:yes stop_codon:yes gene_type:complete